MLCEHGIELSCCAECGTIMAEAVIEDQAMERYFERKYGARNFSSARE